jgi:hypothetical protein
MTTVQLLVQTALYKPPKLYDLLYHEWCSQILQSLGLHYSQILPISGFVASRPTSGPRLQPLTFNLVIWRNHPSRTRIPGSGGGVGAWRSFAFSKGHSRHGLRPYMLVSTSDRCIFWWVLFLSLCSSQLSIGPVIFSYSAPLPAIMIGRPLMSTSGMLPASLPSSNATKSFPISAQHATGY